MGICLAIKGPSGQPKRVDFDQTKVTIGSSALCDVCVFDPGVDAEQAVLVVREAGIELFDIGESGGVLVNGTPQGHSRVVPGDEIWIGGTVLSLVEQDSGAVSFTESTSTVRAEVETPTAPPPRRAAPIAPVPATEQRFALLDEVRGLVNSIASDTEDTFEAILDTLFSNAPVRRGFIALAGEDDELKVRAHRNREHAGVGGGPIEVSRTLVGQVLRTGKAVLTSDAESDPDLRTAASIHRLRIKAAICVPLVTKDRVIGVLYGDNREKPGALTRDHLSIVSALASVAGAAVETGRLLEQYDAKLKLEQALSIARSIQLNFLPSEPPQSSWLDIWGRSDSCDETGGDYFDFFEMAGGRTGIVIADVTGHGVGSALLMASVRASLRALMQEEPDLERLVFKLNNLIHQDVHDGRFITFFIGRFDPHKRIFEHVGAGHTPPVFFRAKSRSTKLIMSKGPPLGILGSMEFVQGSAVPLEPGDVVLFTTDGIMEAGNPEGDQFGLVRLRGLVAEQASKSSRELVETICGTVDDFVQGAPLIDDSTLVAVKVR